MPSFSPLHETNLPSSPSNRVQAQLVKVGNCSRKKFNTAES